jgi:hypothetical protein
MRQHARNGALGIRLDVGLVVWEPGQITIANIAGSDLPDSINRLADDPEAWVTR